VNGFPRRHHHFLDHDVIQPENSDESFALSQSLHSHGAVLGLAKHMSHPGVVSVFDLSAKLTNHFLPAITIVFLLRIVLVVTDHENASEETQIGWKLGPRVVPMK